MSTIDMGSAYNFKISLLINLCFILKWEYLKDNIRKLYRDARMDISCSNFNPEIYGSRSFFLYILLFKSRSAKISPTPKFPSQINFWTKFPGKFLIFIGLLCLECFHHRMSSVFFIRPEKRTSNYSFSSILKDKYNKPFLLPQSHYPASFLWTSILCPHL